MNKELFFEKIREYVSNYYEGRAKVSVHDVRKNNGTIRHGLCVTLSDSNCGPTVYLDEAYDKYNEGECIEDIAEALVETFDTYAVSSEVDLSFFGDFDKVREAVCFKLISSEKNAELLKEIPNRKFSDLSVVYYVSLDFMSISGSIMIKNEHIDMWDVTEEDLYEAAMDNTPRKLTASFIPMEEMLSSMMQGAGADLLPRNSGIYVATNDKKIFGSSVILYPGFLKEVHEYIGENYYILPSSIHELIIMKESVMKDEAAMGGIVRSVNDSCVSMEDYLSDSVYYYDLSDDTGENNVKKVEYASGAMLL